MPQFIIVRRGELDTPAYIDLRIGTQKESDHE